MNRTTQGNGMPRMGLKRKACMPLLAALALACSGRPAAALDIPQLEKVHAYKASIPAPEFPAGGQWLNTDKPLSLKGLRGKVVLLDFWTYCCINCMHVLPDLHVLEAEFGAKLVVLGVHSAKFSAEQASSKIRKAILRYKVSHPVFNDNQLKVWNLYGVQAWPTLVLIAPDGNVLGQVSGEGNQALLERSIQGLLLAYASQVHDKPLALRLESSMEPQQALSFPGKVLADGKGGRIFVADSDHDRIVIASLSDGSRIAVAGCGKAGLLDGAFALACFHNPQGLALSQDGRTLYVADTGNHALRALDLEAGSVKTLAGDGTQAAPAAQGGRGAEARLNSPWDLALLGGSLYVAMAGAHQIWRMDLGSAQIKPWAGSGDEDLRDGALAEARLAQPSGICTDGQKIYSADSESSSIRAITPGEPGLVRTLVGKGLFDFGDSELKPASPQLQHPLGVHYSDGLLYVADTFNNRIKTVDPSSGETRFFCGTGAQGKAGGPPQAAQFDEPGGLWVSGGKLYVADTNNNAIRVVDLSTRAVSEFQFRGL
jgi:thiol-disulfide isomerase/thioredoxin